MDVREAILSDVMGEIEQAVPQRTVAARRGPVRRALRVMAATVALVGASLVTGANPAYAGTCGNPDPKAANQFYSCRVGAGVHTYYYEYLRKYYSSSPYPHYCYVFWVTVKAPCAFGQFETTKCA